jgi:oligopeptide/dipeptide ABC transporter ATP-binding protein
MSKNLLEIDNLKTYFYTHQGVVKAVDGVTWTVKKNESVGLVGESGCGKTVTALSIMRLVQRPGRIVEGEIIFEGRNILELKQTQLRQIRGKKISMIFQDPMTFLNPLMKVEEQIAEVIWVHQGLDKEEAKKKALELMKVVQIPSPSTIGAYDPHQLSGGMRQRILIAAAISCSPSLLIMDEPTTALDIIVQAQIIDLIKRLQKEIGLSTVLISHDLGVVAEMCNKVYVMYAGKIVEGSDALTLYENPAHPYTSKLLESVLSIDTFKEKLPAINGVVPNLIDPPSGCRFHPRCPQAKAICSQREPPVTTIDLGHIVSCWLYS